ncbi:alpha/beta fold hydrolase [Vagococcus coleopterorum]|uniref:Alpha/beta fold hydrolase n=1 Tax=Vagococcus coleopterorum TaxID=2714946 RepID=A0A6G8ANM6_9ENTE|nr:alpha/beta fold hydrolase [Vagococcus coleopterorum]QIL46684.1 alpha/beta fold hydrolase [Vagococcus coleopterorum]
METNNVKLPETVFLKGGKRAVVLMHAYTGNPNDVRSLGRVLNSNGYTVLMPLFAGHGTKRAEDILAAGPESWHQQLVNHMQHLKDEGYDEVAVFGLSLGGVFAMSALERYPEQVIGGGIFCSPIAAEIETNILPTFKYYARTNMKRAGSEDGEVEQRMSEIEKTLPIQLAEISDYSAEVFHQLKTVKQPTLLVQAGQDKMINPDDVYDVADELINSQPQIKWYPESGHVITIGPEKKEFEADVLLFINQLNWHYSLEA